MNLQQKWDGENWMRDYAPKIGDRPLSELRIPGTHDAGTFSIPKQGAVIATAQKDAGTAQFAGVPEDFILGTQVTQNRTFTEQFDDGIRYIDFRLVCDPEGMFIVHTFRGMPIDEALAEIGSWADAHPHEVIFFDVQKNYGCDQQTYVSTDGRSRTGDVAFAELVKETFGSKLAPRPTSSAIAVTLNSLVSAGTNIVPFFINQEVARQSDLWWFRACNALPEDAGMTNIWNPYITMPEMFQFLLAEAPKYEQRCPSELLLGAIATSPMFPKDTGIAKWYSDWKAGTQVGSLREFIETTVLPDMPTMVAELSRVGYNVLSTDFYDLGKWPNGISFAQLVVDQN